MSPKSSPKSCAMTPAARAVPALLGLFLVGAAAALGSGCEDKAIGRPCDVQSDAGPMQAVYNPQALECPSRICIKPSREQGVATDTKTAPYCTAECSKDSDCDGERRDPSNGLDRRCQSGFVCGVAFEVGPLCCRKLCLCRDFISQSGGLMTPASCDKSKGVSTCQNL
jgi:hypothetical protein